MEDYAFDKGASLGLGENDAILLLAADSGAYYVAEGNEFSTLLNEKTTGALQQSLDHSIAAGNLDAGVANLFSALDALYCAAFGRGNDSFSDVPEDAWYAQSVEVCVQAGLMEGTGDGQFSPQLPLSQPECLTLALRLYDLNHGGDGVLPHAPESWSLGSFSLTFDDGTELSVYVSDPAAVNFQPTGIRFLLDEAQAEWGSQQDGAAVTLRYEGNDYAGRVAYQASKYGQPAELFFPVDYGTPFYEVYDRLTERWGEVPAPNAWYRDAWYYLEQNGLEDQFYFSFGRDDPATREQFCRALFQAAGPLEAVNLVDDVPDTADGNILALYRAGVLTGRDGYGTFVPESSVTRAEAAALCARVLRPELRVSFTPAPLPETGYTLTWLVDGEPGMGTPNTNICNVYTEDDDYFITLEGKRVEWPEGKVLSFSYNAYLDYLVMGTYFDNDVRNIKEGIMDGNGDFVVPLRTYDLAYPTGDGHFVVRREDGWLLLDSRGAPVSELPELAYTEGAWQDFNEGLVPRMDPDSSLYGYAGADGQWVLAPRWIAAFRFSSGYALVADERWNYGVIDHSGKLVIPTDYQELSLFQNSPGYTGGGYFLYTDAEGQNGWLSPDGTVYPGAPGLHNGLHMGFSNGYAVVSDGDNGVYYLGSDLLPASRKFDWAGPVGADGRGFVGLDEKIYRIDFTPETK